VRIDGRRRQVWVFFAGNSRYGAPADDDTRAHERADLADGLVDVRVVSAERMFSQLRLVAAVLTGGLERSPVYRSAAMRDVRLATDGEPLVLSLDGEPKDCGTTVTVGKLRTRLAVYRPTDVMG
jgi:diacylglycerol kinase family enzyme